ncbi:alpha/beta-hydrolase [Thelephora ganbajun]|uniref:Alpha/beta-hydrolase n=1 Tax=Thelephora ganbajun TaxID=370292 RepID=A0ACB6ZB60_THEGA|nr:alpha/beta-hydrolase [Thelephora ganbajun]
MVFVNTKVILPLLAALTALAAPLDNVDSSVSPVVDVVVDSDPTVGVDPTPAVDAVTSLATVTSMTNGQVNALTPYTYYASAGYCNPSVTQTWTCGANCNANPGFKPIASGGDGSSTQFWYVGYDPTLQTIVVVHQGTDGSQILPLLTDADIILDELSTSLFPGVPSSIRVHDGFANAHANAANTVLSAVITGVNTYGTRSVTTVGHSLGAAISLLDAIFLPLHISGLTVTYYGYGLPRVGNQDFANYVDSQLAGRFTRITNHKDPIPIVPGRFLGFHHPSGEAHIDGAGVWRWCSGQDNTDAQCSIGDTPNLFVSDSNNHRGPYNGITISC